MSLFSRFLLFSSFFLISFAIRDDQVCFGEQCEKPRYLEDSQHCSDLDCETKENLLKMISELQKEKHEEYMKPSQSFQKAIQADQQCSICSTPGLCLNGGTCVADVINPWKYYHCLCPDSTAGQNCEKVISCDVKNPCGKNADCYVQNHQLNCICKPGYTARRNGRDCDMKVIQACMTGDPHYTTYDNLHFDYQGTCPYVFSEPCNILPSPYGWFSVRAKNELPAKGYHISQVSEVEVDLYNITIHIDGRSKTTLVNGVQVIPPFYYPNKSNWILRVRTSGSRFIIENDQGINVAFYPNSWLCVEVPNIPEFQGASTLCGLAGNIDGKWSDDVVNRNGTVLPIQNSRQPTKNNHYEFMTAEDSWITDKFLVLRPGQENCLTGQILDNTTNCDSQAAADACFPIKQAETGEGPFAACSSLGVEYIDNYYQNCIYDICANPNFKCTTLTYFMQYCQLALPAVPKNPSWRSDVNCPLACPKNSHNELCASSCASTCAEPYPENCYEGCVDGCVCDPGYVIDNSVFGTMKCVRLDQCGCTDDNGNMHPASTPWVTDNCTIFHECRNGSLYSDYRPCDENAECVTYGYTTMCRCETGFRGDGYTCTDINECVETPGICGHGTCTNLPGSYSCKCDDYWLGNNCNQYKPRRHCADLYVYWGVRLSGAYNVNPPYVLPKRGKFDSYEVYCDMTTNGGGYTLISSDTGSLNVNKTYSDYLNGFGVPIQQSVFLGLEFIHQLTTSQPQNLRVNLHRCASNGRPERSTACTYPTFAILDASTQYSVVIRQPCSGSEAGDNYYEDGWARWDLTQNGPKFSTWDIEEAEGTEASKIQGPEQEAYRYSCSHSNFNTGWWYTEDQLCGAANLNGVRYQCPDIPLESERYLRWSEGTIQQSWMYLRPTGYPNYDIRP